MDEADLIGRARALYAAFMKQDRAAAEALLAPDFRFTSPYDDHIDREAWFDRCWPNADRLARQDLREVMQAGDVVLVAYECESMAGAVFRNVERLEFANGQVRAVEVFFGDPPAGLTRAEFAAG